MMSNDKYKSVEHRVLANPHREPRVSIPVFFTSSKTEDSYEPLPELVSSKKPAIYQKFTILDFMSKYYSEELQGKSTVEWWDCASIPNCLPLDNETLGFTVEAEEITALEWNGGIAQASPTVSTVEWWDCASIPNCLPLDNETLGFTVEAEEITALEVPHHCTTQIRYNCICRRSSSK
ncbi:unnamed protein product [Ilex paraguariensis]|uniref:Isopenicillin N synthase-like Fe(2+) 2OG dioxygenase domain-containing protein n=1 Tax=Ilex paraguariensis TaxID=185542 RepID=A0ABC8UT36_9AQUA